MSKMTMPRVDVVRFQESDVIVASTLILTNYSDNKTSAGIGNGSITYRGNTYSTTGGDPVFSQLDAALGGRNMVTMTSSEKSINIESVFYFEVSNDPQYYQQVETNDGIYVWDGSSWVWRRSQ